MQSIHVLYIDDNERDRALVADALLREDAGFDLTVSQTFEDFTQRLEEGPYDLLLTDFNVLEETNRELDAFTYSVAHDLRAPLRLINGFASILSRRYRNALDEEGQRNLDYILQAEEKMSHLIVDLLKFARLGRTGVEFSSVLLSAVLEEICRTLQTGLETIQGSIIIDGELPELITDRTLLQQILTNLIENALLYRRAAVAVQVHVGCRNENGWVELYVRDNGIGIPAEHQDIIFHIFQRLHPDSQFPGSGIGLAIVRKAVSLLGGKVRVESLAGTGSTFFIRLPLLPATIGSKEFE